MKKNNIIANFLTTEHAVFCELFDEIDRLLPDVRTVAEVRLLARLVEGVLSCHADVEQNLAYAALDQALAEKGELTQLYQDHDEIDACFHYAGLAEEFPEAVRFLRAGIKASREHFRREEETVFPLFEKLFGPAALEALGAEISDSGWPLGFAKALRGHCGIRNIAISRTARRLSPRIGNNWLWPPELNQLALPVAPPTHHPTGADYRRRNESASTMDDCT